MATRVIECDVCNDTTFDGKSRLISAKRLRAMAAAVGWMEHMGRDFCPKCWASLEADAVKHGQPPGILHAPVGVRA